MSEPTQSKKLPAAGWKSRGVDVTLWETKNEHGTFYSVKAVHRFKRTQDNQWDESSSFPYEELPLLVEFLSEAFKKAMHADVTARGEKKLAAARYP